MYNFGKDVKDRIINDVIKPEPGLSMDLDFGERHLTTNRTRLQEAILGRDVDYLVQEIELLKDEIEELKIELMLAESSFDLEERVQATVNPKRRRNFYDDFTKSW